MAVAELSQFVLPALTEQDIEFLWGIKKKRASQAIQHQVKKPKTEIESIVETMRNDTVPLGELLDAAGVDYRKHPHKATRLIEYQCAVLSNSQALLEGAIKAESLIDVKIKRIDPPAELTPEENYLRALIGLGEPLPRSNIETDLDVVTFVTWENGIVETHAKEVAASGKSTLTKKQHNVGHGEPKPVVVKRAYDGAKLNNFLYRIPREVMHVDSYTVIIPPHKGVADAVLEYIRSTAYPLVSEYSRQQNGSDFPVYVRQAPIDWTTRTKRWHRGMPQQDPSELKKLDEQLEDIPRGGFRVNAQLTNLEKYRHSSQQLLPLYSGGVARP